jgi:MraZ protein
MFRGRHRHTIDTKGRLSIPTGYRMELQRRSDQPPILTSDEVCLRLYPYDDWCEYEKAVAKRSTVDPTARDYARVVIAGAVEAPIDSQGRILVPRFLREHAHLEREVTLAGVGLTVEIWDTRRLEANLNQTQANFREISAEMADKLGS